MDSYAEGIELKDIVKEHPVQILHADADSNTFKFDSEALHSIIVRIPKNVPIAVLSVVGAFRSGKSFLLDFFLRCLRYSSKQDTICGTSLGHIPEWMNYGGDILEGTEGHSVCYGFSYKGGRERNTQGIWMWSEPFLLPSKYTKGGKVCVLLMDTQGLFDTQTGQMLTTSIFGLSTLLSSYQIYNIEKRLQEDNLQHLALFSEYSRVVLHGDDSKRVSCRLSHRNADFTSQIDFSSIRGGDLSLGMSILETAIKHDEEVARRRRENNPFQQLDFLVRDWQHFEDEMDIKRCLGEMDVYKKEVLGDRETKDLHETREHIHNCFQTLGLFLLPHPGLEVTRPSYNGSLRVVSPAFLRLLGFYIEKTIFSLLQPKLINKEMLTAEDFEAFAVVYGKVFTEASSFPEAMTLLSATAQATNQTTLRHAIELYNAAMSVHVNKDGGFVRAEDFQKFHQEALEEALGLFDKRATMGNLRKIAECRDELMREIEQACERFSEENDSRNLFVKLEKYYLLVGLVAFAYVMKFFLSIVCASWSSTCRAGVDFFSMMITAIIIYAVFKNKDNIMILYQTLSQAFHALNGTPKPKTD